MSTNYDVYPRVVTTDQGTADGVSGSIPAALGVPATLRCLPVTITAGAGGSPDDVTFTFPEKALVVQMAIATTTAVGASTITLRSAAAGAGSAGSSAVTSGSTGTAWSSLTTAMLTFAAGATGYLRRSDNGAAGTALVLYVPIQ